MRIPTTEAARKLGISVQEVIDASTALVGDLSDVWPEIDEGFVATMQQLLGLDAQRRQADEDHAGCTELVRVPTGEGMPRLLEAKLRILDKLERAGRWGGNTVSWDTLRNHYCRGVEVFEDGLEALVDEGLLIVGERGSASRGPFSLNPAKKRVIEQEVARIRS